MERDKLSDVPAWLNNHIRKWQKRLFLCEWKIKASMVEFEDDEVKTNASILLYPDVRIAILTINKDIVDNLDAEKTIIHELLHIRFATITEYIRYDILMELSPSARTIADRWMNREMEPIIEILSGALLTSDIDK